jgi:putrescine transport system substrate-binding protein
VDNFCVPVNARNAYTASVFINYCLRPKVSAQNANFVRSANTNLGARRFTDPGIVNNPSLYLPAELMERCEFMSRPAPGPVEDQRNEIWRGLAGGGS